MFKYFRRVAQQIYMETFCQGYFDICERRKMRAKGQAVPDNLLPHGGLLWENDRYPPPQWGVD
jgi:hypothetical protein